MTDLTKLVAIAVSILATGALAALLLPMPPASRIWAGGSHLTPSPSRGIPPIDAIAPARTRTATFALG